MTRRPNEEVAERSEHEQQPESITDEARNADQHPTDEDDQPIQQLPGRHLSSSQPLPGVGQHPEADAAHNKRSERAGKNESCQRREEADLVGNGDECRNLSGNSKESEKEEHNAR